MLCGVRILPMCCQTRRTDIVSKTSLFAVFNEMNIDTIWLHDAPLADLHALEILSAVNFSGGGEVTQCDEPYYLSKAARAYTKL